MRLVSRVSAALLCAAAACAHPGRLAGGDAAPPVLAATPEELTRRIDADARAIGSLKGTLAIAFEARAGGGARSCSALLVARSRAGAGAAAGLYMKGYRSLLPTLFTLVSDGERFWLHVPHDNVVYTGPIAHRGAAEVRGIRLEAQDLFRALFVEPVGGAEVDVREEPSEYVVSARRAGRVERRLWVERRRLTVARESWYDGDGREALSIERERWEDAGGRLYPARLRLRDAATGASVTLDFEKLAVNPTDLRPEAFRPRTPAGARVVTVGGEGNPT